MDKKVMNFDGLKLNEIHGWVNFVEEDDSIDHGKLCHWFHQGKYQSLLLPEYIYLRFLPPLVVGKIKH